MQDDMKQVNVSMRFSLWQIMFYCLPTYKYRRMLNIFLRNFLRYHILPLKDVSLTIFFLFSFFQGPDVLYSMS